MFFKQRTARLFNGQKVRLGDRVMFENSDGVECIGTIKHDVNDSRRLFFWNNGFEITDYRDAEKI